MSSLQIRKLPDDIYQLLAFRAERAHRNLAQQAIFELRKAAGNEIGGKRRQVLNEIRNSLGESKSKPVSQRPEDLIREDRER